jgi:hypothetical protein
MLMLASFVSADIPVPPLKNEETTMQNAKIDVLRGMISADRRVNSFSFTPQRDGICRFEITELKQNVKVSVAVFDGSGEAVASAGGVGRGNGVTLGVSAGKTYRIQVGQHTGFSAYTLIAGHQKEAADVSGLTGLNDSMQYTDQRNVYLFTAPMDGNYRFEVGNLKNTMRVNVYAFTAEGELLRRADGVGGGHGLTLSSLREGETYEIHVAQHTGFGGYAFIIGQQKEPVDIGLDRVSDSMQYTDQRNVYFFTVPADGRYRFELGDLPRNARASLYAFDPAGSVVQYTVGVGNAHGLTLSGLAEGEVYQIQVRQYSGLGAYTLSVFKQ